MSGKEKLFRKELRALMTKHNITIGELSIGGFGVEEYDYRFTERKNLSRSKDAEVNFGLASVFQEMEEKGEW